MIAEQIAAALKGRKKTATGYIACCPAHGDSNPSLSIREGCDGKVLIKCHAGCSQERVISALKELGVWPNCGRKPFVRRTVCHGSSPVKASASEQKHSEYAFKIWEDSKEASGSLASVYLTSRGITFSPPPTIRCHLGLKHPSGETYPAMIGLVTTGDDDTPKGIHRTYLATDGRGKAQLDNAKLMLGPCSGGAVRLQEAADVVMVGEGIETCLSAMQETGLPAWAALSTSGMRSLILPKTIQEVIILVDGDQAGEAAAITSASRWTREGRKVKLARPPQGMDFNDMLINTIKKNSGGRYD